MPAKMKKLSDMVAMPMMDKAPTRLTINLKDYPGFEEKELGDSCEATLKGKVTRINMDENYQEMTIEIDSIKPYGKGGEDVEEDSTED